MQFANAPMDSNFNWLLCSLDLRFKTKSSPSDLLPLPLLLLLLLPAVVAQTQTEIQHTDAASGLREVNERIVNQSIDV